MPQYKECENLKRTSAKEDRKERLLKFILKTRTSVSEKKSTKILGKPPPSVKSTVNPEKTDLASCLIITSPTDPRLSAGEYNPPGKLPRTDSECQFKAPGHKFLTKRNTNVTEQVLVLEPSRPIVKELKNQCDPVPLKDQITQTLYRESSAQTLAYLPKPEAWGLEGTPRELFTLPSVLPGDEPPGLYEVEMLERSRKRWAFYEAMQINQKRLRLQDKKLNMEKYKNVFEAFEWEDWMQREENIQDCQMRRLEIVIRMFDKREREMHATFRTRTEQACECIEKRRREALRKNELEFQRAMRHLKNKVQTKWKKEAPSNALGEPDSEFYGPHMRYGVDPVRRHFNSKTGQCAFDRRIDDLEKQVNISSLKCSFKKRNPLAESKSLIKETEKNLCKEEHLQEIYIGLNHLRRLGEVDIEKPKCLKMKFNHLHQDERKTTLFEYHLKLRDLYHPLSFIRTTQSSDEPRKRPSFLKTMEISYTKAQSILNDQKNDDMENLISSYVGTSIGSLMQFLSDETVRLQEQRNLHFISLLAQKERWHREAVEAGLRQKENVLRNLYEDIFQHSVRISKKVTDNYVSHILTEDVERFAEMDAAETVTEMAKQIDMDIQRWLETFNLIQNPLIYIPLMIMLRDMFCTDMDALRRQHEQILIVQYILQDVVFERVWQELEPYDVASTLTSDLIDRLIDNDLYLFSSDSESERPQTTSWYEAQAIIRKLIRQSVPGRRWKEESERIVHENYNDLLDDIFAEIIFNAENPEPAELNYTHLKHCVSSRELDLRTHYRLKTQLLIENIIKNKAHAGKPQLETKYVVMQTHKDQEDELSSMNAFESAS